MTIDAIQVGIVAIAVPPGSVPYPGTVVVGIGIIILISSCEWLIVVPIERVTSSSCEIKLRNK